jgi:hypothetical protein
VSSDPVNNVINRMLLTDERRRVTNGVVDIVSSMRVALEGVCVSNMVTNGLSWLVINRIFGWAAEANHGAEQ